MKYLSLITISLLLAGCNFNKIEITGAAPGMDGGIVSIIGGSGKTYFTQVIKAEKYAIKQQPLPAFGYFTLSVQSGPFPHDFEIYLEPGKYTIDIPKKDGVYPKIIAESKIQNNLSIYYNFENSIMNKFRKDADMLSAKLSDPKVKLSEAEVESLVKQIQSSRNREHGLRITIMDMFIKKYPKNDIVPHIITNMDYQNDPQPYYILYKKLSPEVQSSEEGGKIGEELQQLIKQNEAKQVSVNHYFKP